MILVHIVLQFMLVNRNFAYALKMVVCLIAKSALVLFVVGRANEHTMLVTVEATRRSVLVRVDFLDLDVFKQLVVAHVPLVCEADLELR